MPRFQYLWSQLCRVFYVHRQARTGSKLMAAVAGVGETGQKIQTECALGPTGQAPTVPSIGECTFLDHVELLFKFSLMFALFSPEFKRKRFTALFCNLRDISIYFLHFRTRIGGCCFATRNNCSPYKEDGVPGLRTSDSTRAGAFLPSRIWRGRAPPYARQWPNRQCAPETQKHRIRYRSAHCVSCARGGRAPRDIPRGTAGYQDRRCPEERRRATQPSPASAPIRSGIPAGSGTG